MSNKLKPNKAKVSLIKKKIKLNERSMLIDNHLLRLMQDTREYALSTKSSPFVKEFHKNQTVLVEESLWFSCSNIEFLLNYPSKSVLKESQLSVDDIGYKRMGIFLYLDPNKPEEFDDVGNIDEQDIINFKVANFASVLSVYKDHVQLKIIKCSIKNCWFYDSYYYKLPLNFIELYIQGENIDMEIKRSYEAQEYPSDNYLISHCERFIELIIFELYKKKYQRKPDDCVMVTELNFKNYEQYRFKIWQC
jgi:hypothetical protein